MSGPPPRLVRILFGVVLLNLAGTGLLGWAVFSRAGGLLAAEAEAPGPCGGAPSAPALAALAPVTDQPMGPPRPEEGAAPDERGQEPAAEPRMRPRRPAARAASAEPPARSPEGPASVSFGPKTEVAIESAIGGLKGEVVPADGDLTAATTNAVFQSHKSALRDCYERGLKRAGALRGQVRLRIEVSPAGRVRSVDLSEGTLRSPRVIRCLRERIADWRFPKPLSHAVLIHTTLSFAPEDPVLPLPLARLRRQS